MKSWVEGKVVAIEDGKIQVKTKNKGLFFVKLDKRLWKNPAHITVRDDVQIDPKELSIINKHRRLRRSPCGRWRVAILGLSANPITKAHKALGKLVSKTNLFDEIWFMPCYQHPFGKEMCHPWDRYRWCQLAVKQMKKMYVASRYEQFLQHTGSTYDLMLRLKEDFPKYRFHWIIGSDNVININKWDHALELKEAKAIPFVIVPRHGYELPPGTFWYHYEPHILLKDQAWDGDCSSTLVRELLRKKDPEVKNYIDKIVYDSIMEENIKF